MKIKIPEEKATKVLTSVREGEDMGTLFENFQTFDWKGVNEELEKTKERLKDVEKKLEQTEARADEKEAMLKQEKERADRLEKELQELRSQLK